MLGDVVPLAHNLWFVEGEMPHIEFPHSPPSLQNVMASSLLEIGYEAVGPRRHERFFQPSGSAVGEP